jgi:hypothetical protein
MMREFKRLGPLMEGRGLLGELDHPGDGKTSLKRVSHVITHLEIKEDNSVFGVWEVIPGTTHGKQLQALADANVQLGVSSRGLGSVIRDRQGNSVVQEDFKLLTYDVVADPAVGDAVPEMFYEGYIPNSTTISEVAFNPNAEAAFIQRLKEEGVDNIDALIAKVREQAIAESRNQRPYAVQGNRSAHAPDVADQIERSRAGAYERGLSDGVDKFMKNDFVGKDIATMQTIREHIVSTTDIESELLEQAENIRQVQEIRIESMEEEIVRRDDMIARLSGQLREQFETSLIAHHIARVPDEHRQHFVEMVGPTREFGSIELLENHVRVVANEFLTTGRYYDNDVESILSVYEDLNEAYDAIDELQGEISGLKGKIASYAESMGDLRGEFENLSAHIDEQSGQIEVAERALGEERDRTRRYRLQLQKAVSSLSEVKEIIGAAERAKKALSEENQLWKDKAVELREHLSRHTDLLRQQCKTSNRLEEQVESMRRREREMGHLLEESKLDAYKYEKAFGSQDPNGVFNMLAEARSKEQVDSFVARLNESRIPMQVHSSFRGGSQIHDHLMTESTVHSMNQRMQNMRSNVSVQPGARPDLLSENNTNHVESSSGPALDWPTQEVTESRTPAPSPSPGLPGLDPSKMLGMIKRHAPE